MLYAHSAADAATPVSLSSEIRYALIQSSVHSLAESIHPDLTAALVAMGYPGWTSETALFYLTQISHPSDRVNAIVALAPVLSPDAASSALTLLPDIAWWDDYVRFVSALLPALPPPLQHQLLQDALTRLMAIPDRLERSEKISSLAACLPPGVIDDAAETAKEIEDHTTRALVLARLCRFLPEAQRLRIAAVLLSGVGNLASAAAKEVLVELAQLLPEEDLPRLLDLIQGLEIDRHIAEVLTVIAPRLSSDLLYWAYEIAIDLVSPYPRATALAGLVPFLPPGLASEIQQQLLSGLDLVDAPYETGNPTLDLLLESSRPGEQQAGLLAALMPALPEDSLRSAVGHLGEVARDLDPWSLSRIVAKLIPNLPFADIQSLLNEALERSSSIRDDDSILEFFLTVLPYLSAALADQLVPPLIEKARALEFGYDSAKAMAELSSYVNENAKRALLQDALRAVEEIEARHLRCSALADVASRLQTPEREELLKNAERAAREIERSDLRLRALLGLIPYVTPPAQVSLAHELLDAVSSIANAHEKAETIALVTPYLPPLLRSRALELATGIPDYSRITAVAEVVPHLDRDSRKALSRASLQMPDESDRAWILAGILSEVAPEERKRTVSLAISHYFDGEFFDDGRNLNRISHSWAEWYQQQPHEALEAHRAVLQSVAKRRRSDLLSVLRALTPLHLVVGGEELIASIALAVLDVTRWWP